MSDAKRQKLDVPAADAPTYELIYWPSIPGRGEYVRLAFEATGTPYVDVGNSSPDGVKAVLALIDDKRLADDAGNPPVFAPPVLKIVGGKNGGKDLLIHQTPNILAYLGERLGLVGEAEEEKYYVQQIALTALDLCNEAHDTHHPIASGKYYDDQKEEALKKAEDFRADRIPKFFGYFERLLKSNESKGKGKYLVGSKVSYADTTAWQVVDGVSFAFPKEVEARKKDYPLLFETFYPGIKEESGIKEYLASERRLKYSEGLFRHYPELDRQ